MTDLISDYSDFLASSPTSFHAAANISALLEESGYTRQLESDPWQALPKGYIRTGGAVIAWQAPQGSTGGAAAGATGGEPAGANITGFRIVGSHTDSPSFKLKPNPGVQAFGFGQVAAEVYGGPLLNSWLNRDLGIAGVVTDIAGKTHLVKTPAVMIIPQLAPHLDRSQNQRLELSPQRDYKPIWALGDADLLDYICAQAGIARAELAAFDLLAYDAEGPRIFGGPEGTDFLASGRQDNLSSAYASLRGFIEAGAGEAARTAAGTDPTTGTVSVYVSFDHEEVGSSTYTGAGGPLLERTLRRIAAGLGLDGEENFARLLAGSWCISADAGHSINPNKPEKHDPDHHPVLGGGPMLKVNASQRYATESEGSALWLRAARAAGVNTQVFVSNNDVPSGSTIGPFTATRLGIRTVDVGIGLLSMHSVREISSPADVVALVKICKEFWAGA